MRSCTRSHRMTQIDSIVTRLLGLHPKLIDLTLDRMWRILDALGHPERGLPPVIHVAGTNGKGSTIAFMRAILEAAGLRVHVYTSPHLVRFNERFRLGAVRRRAGRERRRARRNLERMRARQRRRPHHGVRDHHRGRIAAVRAPCGRHSAARGRARRPARCHQCDRASARHRGDAGRARPCGIPRRHRRQIAAEKAGIFKPDVPAIVAAQPREALPVIERQAARLHAPIRIAGEDWTATEERGRLVYQDDAGLIDLPAPKLYGRHQFENAGLAIAALRAVDTLELAPAAFEGVAKAEWPARMQRLASGALAALVPPGGELWLDGGHNPDGGRVIASALADLEERVSRPLVLIVGMLANKDGAGFLRNFTGLARRVVTVPVPQQKNSLPAAALAEAARAIGLPAQESPDLETALAAIGRFDLDQPPRILITGSLYLAGAALALNGTPPD